MEYLIGKQFSSTVPGEAWTDTIVRILAYTRLDAVNPAKFVREILIVGYSHNCLIDDAKVVDTECPTKSKLQLEARKEGSTVLCSTCKGQQVFIENERVIVCLDC